MGFGKCPGCEAQAREITYLRGLVETEKREKQAIIDRLIAMCDPQRLAAVRAFGAQLDPTSQPAAPTIAPEPTPEMRLAAEALERGLSGRGPLEVKAEEIAALDLQLARMGDANRVAEHGNGGGSGT